MRRLECNLFLVPKKKSPKNLLSYYSDFFYNNREEIQIFLYDVFIQELEAQELQEAWGSNEVIICYHYCLFILDFSDLLFFLFCFYLLIALYLCPYDLFYHHICDLDLFHDDLFCFFCLDHDHLDIYDRLYIFQYGICLFYLLQIYMSERFTCCDLDDDETFFTFLSTQISYQRKKIETQIQNCIFSKMKENVLIFFWFCQWVHCH